MRDAYASVHALAATEALRNAHQTAHLIAATVGFIAFGLLWLDVLWGTLLRLGWAFTRVRHSTLHSTHYSLALLGLVLGIVHAAGQLAVPEGPVGLVNEFVPFSMSESDNIGVGLGVVATEILLAMALSVMVQKKLGFNRWRRLHTLAYPAFIALTLHIIIAGSEMKSMPARLAVGGAAVLTILFRAATSPFAASMSQRANERLSRQTQASQITVSVDPIKCARFGFCEHEAPDVFKLGGDGRLTYKRQVPARRAEAVISAAAVCPARAIMVERMATSIIMPGVTQPSAAQPGAAQPTGNRQPPAPAQPQGAAVSQAAQQQLTARQTWSGTGRQTWSGTGRHGRGA